MVANTVKQLSNAERHRVAERWFRDEIKRLGGVVLGEYKGSKTPVEVECRNHHRCMVFYDNLKKHGTFCEKCKHLTQRKGEEQFQKELKNNSVLTALEPYAGARRKIKFRCPKGHEFLLEPIYAIRGTGCRQCKNEEQRERYEKTRQKEDAIIAELAVDFFQEHGRRPTARDLYTKLGISQTTFSKKIRHGKLRDYFRSVSFFEGEMEDFLVQHGLAYEHRKHGIIGRQELDFYLPEYQVAIETNDISTHNSTFNMRYASAPPKEKDYHYRKSVDCANKGIRLIHVWDYEWNDPAKRPILENIILGACRKLEQRFYARKCQLVRITPKDERWDECGEFFRKNNIQGNRGGAIVMALQNPDTQEILMAYKFGRAFFGKGKYQWEMVRGATKLGSQVIGGASRLWKSFIREHNPHSIVYYVDFNYFSGNGVEQLANVKHVKDQLGFKNYFVKESKVKNRDPSRHKEIKQLVKEKKVLELYNAGTRVYVWERPHEGAQ